MIWICDPTYTAASNSDHDDILTETGEDEDEDYLERVDASYDGIDAINEDFDDVKV